MTTKLWLAAFAAPLGGGFQHGFHLGVFNLIKNTVLLWYEETEKRRNRFYKPDSTIMNPVLMSSLAIGAFLGSLLSGIFANGMGRKIAILVSTGFLVVGVVSMCLAKISFSFEILFIGRFLIGICVGLNSGIVPTYLIEISKDKYRGMVGSMYGIMVAVGFLYSIIMTLPETLGTAKLWPTALAMCTVPVLIQIVLFVICPESPKYLYINKEEEDEGEMALAWLRNNLDIDEEMDQLREEVAALNDVGPFTCNKLCTDQTIRSPLIICTVIMLGHQFCGVNMVFFYSYEILLGVQFSAHGAKYCVLSMGIEYVLVTILAAFLVEIMGRKPLILISFGGMTFVTFCLTIVCVLAQVNKRLVDSVSYVIVVFHFLFVCAFAIGTATVPWFITQEMHNHDVRPMATAFVTAIGWLGNFIFCMSFLPLLGSVGNFVYAFYFAANLITFLFLLFTMRETMDETSVDIIDMFYDW